MNRLPLSQRWPRAERASEYVDVSLAWMQRALRGSGGLRHRILVTSQPKSGTNLLLKALRELPGPRVTRLGVYRHSLPARDDGSGVPVGVDWPTPVDPRRLARRLAVLPPGGVVVTHVPYSEQLDAIVTDLEMRVTAIIRDPRDVALSLGPYVLARPRHFLHDRFLSMTDEERIIAAIQGLPADSTGIGLLDLGTRMRSALAWKACPGALLLRFEDLVGSSGGGDDDDQRNAVSQLACHVGASVDRATVRGIAGRLFGGTDTFRHGRIGGWREALTDEHRALVVSVVGEDVLTEGGYATF